MWTKSRPLPMLLGGRLPCSSHDTITGYAIPCGLTSTNSNDISIPASFQIEGFEESGFFDFFMLAMTCRQFDLRAVDAVKRLNLCGRTMDV